MNEPKKLCLACPICDKVVVDGDINSHINRHHEETGNIEEDLQCSFPGCRVITKASLMQDHMLAHEFANEESKEDDVLNDSTLARYLQDQEEENLLKSKENESRQRDEELAFLLHKEEEVKQEASQFQQLQERYGMNSKGGGYSQQLDKALKKQVKKDGNVAAYYQKKASAFKNLIEGADSKETCTSGLASSIFEYCQKLRPKKPLDVMMCSLCDHYSSGSGDKGWGCGFRNIQVMLSALLKSQMYKDVIGEKLGSFTMPSVTKLQALIENAWACGYDVAGCEQLNGKLQGTRKWIGTTEAATLLRWMKIRARIVDFHKASGKNKTHPRMFQWIFDYFKSNSEASFPIYIQHQGHSRTCVGIEKDSSNDSLNLLIFDPSHPKEKICNFIKKLETPPHSISKLNIMRRSINQMKYDQLQLLFVDGIYENENELQASKTITSIRIP